MGQPAIAEQVKPRLLLSGMHGIGDNLYSRAVIRQYLTRYEHIWFSTPWPALFHDMPGLSLLDPSTSLRTQKKNVERERDKFEVGPGPVEETKKLWYYSSEIVSGKWNSLPNAMLGNMRCSIPGDYRLPVPEDWKTRARFYLGPQVKPVLLYRPL